MGDGMCAPQQRHRTQPKAEPAQRDPLTRPPVHIMFRCLGGASYQKFASFKMHPLANGTPTPPKPHTPALLCSAVGVLPRRVLGLSVPPAPQRARHESRRAQKIVLQRTTSKSRIGELAPMALCDIHVAGCGEHLPAWGSS